MSAPARGTVIAGRYRLERELARGGMGSVWVAKHLQLEVDVAIKFMSSHYAASPEARARFEREARASAQLKLANAVQVHDFGVAAEIGEGGEGAPFLVMELLDGEDLHTRLQHERRLTPFATLGILGPVCRAVQRAHELGLVHRDLKPANIFLARQGSEVVVKVLDFGIAKDTGSSFGGSNTRTGAMLGSPNYMSPEQIRSSNRVDHRSDLWSIGVIAFECLTGRRPFQSDEVGEVLVDVCTAPIPVPSQIAPELGPEVDRFFAKALTRDPAQRFQSARELFDAFAMLADPAAAGSISLGPQVAPMLAPAAPAPITGGPQQQVPSVARGPGVTTLSPSEQTQQRAASRRVGISLAAVGAAVVLVLVGAVAHRAISPERADVTAYSAKLPGAPEPPAQPSATAAQPPAPPSSASPSAQPATPPSASASATAAPPTRPSAKAPPAPRKGSTKKGEELLEHL